MEKIYRHLSDEELAALLKQGDRLAYTEIYDRYWQMLFLHSYKMLRDEEDALDVLQNTFILLWEQTHIHIHTSFRAYLFRMVRNQTLNAINNSKIRRQHIEAFAYYIEEHRPLIDEELNFKEFSTRIELAVANLPKKMRTIFEKTQNEGMSHKAIAAEMNISENTVKTVLYRARNILRKRLTLLTALLLGL